MSQLEPIGVQQNILSNVQESIAKKTQMPECGWSGNGDNEIFFVTVRAIHPPGIHPVADFQIKLPAPYKHFLLVSTQNIATANSCYLHTRPLGKTYIDADPAITPDGTENWFSLKGKFGGGIAAQFIKFGKGMQQIFLDFGFEIGGTTDYTFTLMCSNGDLDIYTDYFSSVLT